MTLPASTVEQIRELRHKGLTYKAISERLGVAKTTARVKSRDVEIDPNMQPTPRPCERCGKEFISSSSTRRFCSKGCYKAVARDRARVTCVDCGGDCGRGSAWALPSRRRCKACQARHVDEAVSERSKRIEKWWAEGLSIREIASRLGWTTKHAGVEMHRMRNRGYNLPYRQSRKAPRFPEQERSSTQQGQR